MAFTLGAANPAAPHPRSRNFVAIRRAGVELGRRSPARRHIAYSCGMAAASSSVASSQALLCSAGANGERFRFGRVVGVIR